MKRINRIGMLAMSLFVGILSASTVEAKSCKIYKDYDLFARGFQGPTGTKPFFNISDNNTFNSSNNMLTAVDTTRTPTGYAKNASMIAEYPIKIVSGTNIESQDNATETGSWSRDTYYKYLKEIAKNYKNGVAPIIIKYDYNGTTTTDKIYNYTKQDETSVTRYMRHGAYNGNNEDLGTYDIYEYLATASSNDAIIEATLYDDGDADTITSTKSSTGDYFDVTVTRNIPVTKNNDKYIYNGNVSTTFKFINDSDINRTFIPAVYYREYNYCTYEAKIDYVYEDGTTAAKTVEKSDLPDETTYPVDSPSIPNCTPDKTSVDVKIAGKDFHDVVTYKCKKSANEPPKMGPTGDALIYIAWAMGLATIAFVVYFYQKERKKNN